MKQRPRVLLVSGNSHPAICGVGHYTANLLQELQRQRPEWTWIWLARRPKRFGQPFVRYGGIPLIRPHCSWNRRGTFLATSAVKLINADLIHIQEQIHSFYETDAAVRLAKATRAPAVVTLHEFHIELPSVAHTIALSKKAQIIIANDRRNAQRCEAYAGRRADHCWWSPSNVAPPKPSWGVGTRPNLLTTFGLISKIKSFEIVYDALKQVRSEYSQLQWKIVGPFDPATNEYHRRLSNRFDANWVTFTGHFDLSDRRLRTLLGECRIMLLPFGDGASLRRTSLQAAWALGVPVITSSPSADEPVIVDGENCVLVREPTVKAWVGALRRLLASKRERSRLREGSLSTAKRFSWSELGKRHLEMYERALRR